MGIKGNNGNVYGFYNVFRNFLLSIGGLLFVVIIFWMKFANTPNFLASWSEPFDDNWEWVHPDGTRECVSIPLALDTKKGETVILEKTLPDDIPDNAVIVLWVGRDIQILIDGTERVSYYQRYCMLPGGPVKNVFLLVDLDSCDGGKTIRLVKNDKNGSNGYLNEIYYGDSYGIYEEIVRINGFRFFAALILLFIALICVIISIVIYLKKHEGAGITMLGIGIFLLAAWVVFDNPMFQCFFRTIYLDGVSGYIVSMLVPIPFMDFLNREQGRRYQKTYLIFTIMLFLCFVIVTMLHFTGVCSYTKSQIPMNLVIGGVVFGIVCCMIADIVHKRHRSYNLVMYGMIGLCIGGFLDIIQINMESRYRVDGLFVILGLYFFAVMAILNSVRQLRRIRERATEMEHANTLKSNFLANMSHEIRTPVNAIMGMDEMILRDDINEDVREYANSIWNASRNLLDIINEILDFSKIEAEKMELVEEEYQLSSVLNDVMTMIQIKADHKNLKLAFHVDKELPDYLYGDGNRIRQIMTNLLNNALKYTEQGVVIFQVYGEQKDNELNLCFDVQDTGIGIREEDLDRLFDKFERLDEKRNCNIEGTGLGLPLTKRFVEMMNGEINVASNYGHGSTFSVIIPQKIAKRTPIGDIQEQMQRIRSGKVEQEKIFVAPKAEILVVDDNLVNLKVVENLLKRTKIKVDTCDSGKRMLHKITTKQYDVILLDYMMPEMNGLETLQKSKKTTGSLNKETPVIALTANAIKGVKEQYLKAGFTDYLSKPVSGNELEVMLLKYLPKDKVETTNETTSEITSTEISRTDGYGLKGKSNVSFKEPDEFNFSYALSILGTEDILRDTLCDCYSYLADVKETLDECIVHISDEEAMERYRIKVHALKGVTESVGALLLSKLSRIMEVAAGKKDAERIQTLHPILIEEIKKHRERIKDVLPFVQ